MTESMTAGMGKVRRVFLDACVLYPSLVRGLLLGAAEAGLFVPLWSGRVLDEWRIAVAAKLGLAAEDEARAAQAEMAVRFPAARVEPAAGAEAVKLPDPADAHVLEAAVAGRADILLTFNLRDFPRRALARQGVEARHPDGFLWELSSVAPAATGEVVSAALAGAGIAPERARSALKRAHLPRLGKAWDATGAGSRA
jgi:predicted nucleic acid-binding protein